MDRIPDDLGTSAAADDAGWSFGSQSFGMQGEDKAAKQKVKDQPSLAVGSQKSSNELQKEGEGEQKIWMEGGEQKIWMEEGEQKIWMEAGEQKIFPRCDL